MGRALLLWFVTLYASTYASGGWSVAYIPDDPGVSRTPIVFLHGMWATPEDTCPLLAPAATRFGVLVCPRGNVLDAGEASWVGTSAEASHAIRLALRASEEAAHGSIAWGSGGTLIGYSSGAYFAAEVACAEPGRWNGLVLLSMKLHLDPGRLRAAGVQRVVLAAGERDDAWRPLKVLEAQLVDAGVETRFVSLGPAEHPLPSDVGSRLCPSIAWVRGMDSAPCASAR